MKCWPHTLCITCSSGTRSLVVVRWAWEWHRHVPVKFVFCRARNSFKISGLFSAIRAQPTRCPVGEWMIWTMMQALPQNYSIWRVWVTKSPMVLTIWGSFVLFSEFFLALRLKKHLVRDFRWTKYLLFAFHHIIGIIFPHKFTISSHSLRFGWSQLTFQNCCLLLCSDVLSLPIFQDQFTGLGILDPNTASQ